MPYSINLNTNVSATIDALQYGLSKSQTLTVTSSNAIQQTVSTITGSAWTSLSTGSLTNVAVIALFNDNAVNSSSVIQFSTSSTGGNVISTLQPGQTAVIPWSGSLNGLYAEVVATSTYPLTNALGTVQYYLQQS